MRVLFPTWIAKSKLLLFPIRRTPFVTSTPMISPNLMPLGCPASHVQVRHRTCRMLIVMVTLVPPHQFPSPNHLWKLSTDSLLPTLSVSAFSYCPSGHPMLCHRSLAIHFITRKQTHTAIPAASSGSSRSLPSYSHPISPNLHVAHCSVGLVSVRRPHLTSPSSPPLDGSSAPAIYPNSSISTPGSYPSNRASSNPSTYQGRSCRRCLRSQNQVHPNSSSARSTCTRCPRV